MLDFIDYFLIRRSVPHDDWTTAGRRIDGDPESRVLYFLPWNTPYLVARHAGFMPLPFLAAYEMPPAIVSSDPNASVAAVRTMIDDTVALLAAHGLDGRDVLFVGLSVGTYPATYLANMFGARLCSVASADRGDLMIWQSPAAARVKERAIAKGVRLSDYARALRGYHPVDNMPNLRPGSTFIVGWRDLLVPENRTRRLLEVGRAKTRIARFIQFDAGHVATLASSARVQLAMHRELIGSLRPPVPRPRVPVAGAAVQPSRTSL